MREYAKAVAAFVVPGLTVLAAALLEGSAGGTAITAAEWVEAAIASLATLGFVYTVPNRPGPSGSDDYGPV